MRWKGQVNSMVRREAREALCRTPALSGRPIEIAFRPSLTAHRNKLLSGTARGHAVHGAAFLRQRRIIIESGLLVSRRELSRVLVHELFHFAWLRLGNPLRRSWEELLASELKRHARGELGWSAESRKEQLAAEDLIRRTRRWREYICESFCDSVAWLYSAAGSHPEHTLAPRFREARRKWLQACLEDGPIHI